MKLFTNDMRTMADQEIVSGILLEMQQKVHSLGNNMIEIFDNISQVLRKQLNCELRKHKMSLADSHNKNDVENIKCIIDKNINTGNKDKSNISTLIKNEIFLDYSHLSRKFSKEMHFSIKQYHIRSNINMGQQMLADGITPTEIAFTLGYSSVAYFCFQFKQITEMTPKQFIKNGAIWIDYLLNVKNL